MVEIKVQPVFGTNLVVGLGVYDLAFGRLRQRQQADSRRAGRSRVGQQLLVQVCGEARGGSIFRRASCLRGWSVDHGSDRG
jgi:hypothetical protein